MIALRGPEPPRRRGGMAVRRSGPGKLKWDTQHLAWMIDHVTSGQSEPAEDCGRRKTLINDSGGSFKM